MLMPPTITSEEAPPKGKPGQLTFAQQLRRNAGLQEHRQRQLLYPRTDPHDPRSPRVRRQSPQRTARLLAVPRSVATPVHHTAVEHPQRYPNEFLYLYLLNPENTSGVRTFVWLRHDPETEDGKGFIPKSRTHSSVYSAILYASNAGYLDASW